ncbi:bifunctional indole-3-glycerol-phosphate synthase TrpC/phosphoribosylanthranilate isomerase TrpF [Vibrio quintilis]|uniref:Multifunctional fusion protein n=1 Tax=Vibrio quintilis TaxID=1117707 RepID=A0A1M7YX38_9VIBR|nr:bifunctional indole-3-glycerol-phosphate synthase TrpC/phosphoribosylanthranilate isomerase TrpF [Vibrio quintilis]SHO57239.1 Tryptophan biosynthesis protein TrpCF [Vibrio quintilis]
MDKQLSEHISTRHTEMAEVLARIVKDKAIWLEERMQSQPLVSFQDELSPSDRSFYDALNTGKTAFILECKKASPSKGLIREDFNLDDIACVYRNHANAISVLTDEKYFQGNLEFLPRVRHQVTQPVLCKDFMLDPYQVSLARYYGADAILLMLSVLEDDAYRNMADVAHSLNMGVLTEVSNEEELERALALNAKVIGINNRNLRDLTTDLNRTKQLAPKIPDGITIISESGIYTNQQVRELAQHAHGFLIGSSLMSEENLELAVRRVTLGENKVCGLTRPQDAAQVYQAGAVYGGLIFVETSPRYVTAEQAKTVIDAAPLNYVGVFRDMPAESLCDIAHQLSLNAVQLHGHEDQAYVSHLRDRLDPSVAIWKAYGVSDHVPEPLLHHVDRHLYDTKSGNQSGGTGLTFDWTQLPRTSDVMLAGGLSPDNAQHAASLGCAGLDFNSGVESAPGIKDARKIQQVFQQVRNY